MLRPSYASARTFDEQLFQQQQIRLLRIAGDGLFPLHFGLSALSVHTTLRLERCWRFDSSSPDFVHFAAARDNGSIPFRRGARWRRS